MKHDSFVVLRPLWRL